MNKEDLTKLGFEGFIPLGDIGAGPARPPRTSGAYAVVRLGTEPVSFLRRSTGGAFKGRDPSVARESLEAKWIDGCEVVYIGRATSLLSRLKLYARFGGGAPVAHWGGRYIWQLTDAEELKVCWKQDDDPISCEAAMIDEFVSRNGELPFANLVRPCSATAA